MTTDLRPLLEPLLPEGIGFTDLYPLTEDLKQPPGLPLGGTVDKLKARGDPLSQVALKRRLNRQSSLKASYGRTLDGILQDAEEGGPKDLDSLVARFSRAARRSFLKAHAIGVSTAAKGEISSRDPELQAFLKDRLQHDITHFKRFLNAIWYGDEKMSRDSRRSLYVKGLDSFFSRGALLAAPDETLVLWRLSPAEHCCLSSQFARVLTNRGLVAISEMKIGDHVLTHRRRWRKVIAVQRFKPRVDHRKVVLKTPTGVEIGCTSDHRWMTSGGWQEANLIAGIVSPWYHSIHAVPKMLWQNAERYSEGRVSKVSASVQMWAEEERVCEALPVVSKQGRGAGCSEGQGQVFVRSVEGRDVFDLHEMSSCSTSSRSEDRFSFGIWEDNLFTVRQEKGSPNQTLQEMPPQYRRPERDQGSQRRAFHLDGTPRHSRSEKIHGHGLCQRKKDRCLSGTLEVGESQWADSGWDGDPSQESELSGRSAPEFGSCFGQGTSTASSPAQFTQDEILYDITVEEDHSFIVEGLISHNSDCIAIAANNPYTKPGVGRNPLPTLPRGLRTQCLSNCKCYLEWKETDAPESDIFGPEPGPGYNIEPEEDGEEINEDDPEIQKAQARVDELAELMAYYKAMYALTEDEKYIRLRKEANAELIELQEKLGVRFVPRAESDVMEKEAIAAVDDGWEPIQSTDSGKVAEGMGVGFINRRSTFLHGKLSKWSRDSGTGTFTSLDGDDYPVTTSDVEPSLLFTRGLTQMLDGPWRIPEVPTARLLTDVPRFQSSYAEVLPIGVSTQGVPEVYRKLLESLPRRMSFNTQLRVLPQSFGSSNYYAFSDEPGVVEARGSLVPPFAVGLPLRQLAAVFGARYYRDALSKNNGPSTFDPYQQYTNELESDLQLQLEAGNDEKAFGVAFELFLLNQEELINENPELYDLLREMLQGVI